MHTVCVDICHDIINLLLRGVLLEHDDESCRRGCGISTSVTVSDQETSQNHALPLSDILIVALCEYKRLRMYTGMSDDDDGEQGGRRRGKDARGRSRRDRIYTAVLVVLRSAAQHHMIHIG